MMTTWVETTGGSEAEEEKTHVLNVAEAVATGGCLNPYQEVAAVVEMGGRRMSQMAEAGISDHLMTAVAGTEEAKMMVVGMMAGGTMVGAMNYLGMVEEMMAGIGMKMNQVKVVLGNPYRNLKPFRCLNSSPTKVIKVKDPEN